MFFRDKCSEKTFCIDLLKWYSNLMSLCFFFGLVGKILDIYIEVKVCRFIYRNFYATNLPPDL